MKLEAENPPPPAKKKKSGTRRGRLMATITGLGGETSWGELVRDGDSSILQLPNV